MHMFGLYSFKPLAVARLSGMRLVHIKRREAEPADAYLRHASAMSAAIAKNLSGVMSQPSELVHTSGTRADAEAAAAFIESHSQYSFIAVVSLMSLFLVITISATGLLLAFCRKKNAVFTASVKEDADSQFELDDIDNSDTEMCRGDKGECYFHLSDDYDEDSDDSEVDEPPGGPQTENKPSRSTTFPPIRGVQASGKSEAGTAESEGRTSSAATPLINGPTANGSTRTGSAFNPAVSERCSKLQHHNPHSSNARFRQNARALVCRNPDHRHFQKQHHNCVYSRPHYHHRRNINHRGGVRLCRQLPPGAAGKLHRSHTIHDIPQTGSESKSTYNRDICGVTIKVENMEHAGADSGAADNSAPLQLREISTIASSMRLMTSSQAGDEDDIFREDETTFNNLKLRLGEFNAAANHDFQPDRYQVAYHDNPCQVRVVGGGVIDNRSSPDLVCAHGTSPEFGQIFALNSNNPKAQQATKLLPRDCHDKSTQQCRHLSHHSISDNLTSGPQQDPALSDSTDSPLETSQCSSVGTRPQQEIVASGEATFQELYSLHELSPGHAGSLRAGETSHTWTARFRPEAPPHPAQTAPAPIPPPPRQRSRRPDAHLTSLRPIKTSPRPITSSSCNLTTSVMAAAQSHGALQQGKTISLIKRPEFTPLVQRIAPPSHRLNTSSNDLCPSAQRNSPRTLPAETTDAAPLSDPVQESMAHGDRFHTEVTPQDAPHEDDVDESDDGVDEVRVCLLQEKDSSNNAAADLDKAENRSLLKLQEQELGFCLD